jgi:hypothetical protein
MNNLNPTFQVPSPVQVAKRAEARKSGIVYSTSTPEAPGKAPVVAQAAHVQTVTVVAAKADGRANTRTRNIRRPRVAKHEFSRLSDGIQHPVTVRRIEA